MPRKDPVPRRKRRTREHVIADLSVNHVERHALLAGFTVQRLVPDYGLDLLIATYDPHGEVESGAIRAQVKATDRLQTSAGGQVLALRVAPADLRYWLLEPTPVILIVYDAQGDRAYWLYVQAYFQSRGELSVGEDLGRITLHIPTANLLDRSAMKRFAAYRDALLAQTKGVVHHD